MGYKQQFLFPEMEFEKNKCSFVPKQENVNVNLVRGLISPYLLGDYEYEGELYLPKSQAVNITLPPDFITMDEARQNYSHSLGVHHFMYDVKGNTTYTNPCNHMKLLSRYYCTISIDFSLFKEEESISLSIMNLIRNRFWTCGYQKQGIKTIPTFVFGHPALEPWWCDGIPENSQVAIGNIAKGRTQNDWDLRQYAIESLIRKKHPSMLIVVGQKLPFDPGIEVRYYKDRLQKIKIAKDEKV